mmetsp:Transcript_14881/g.22891  ORF Transcript_14881/g.22891 Transcript_14881/m.22891 type:complete len:368 (-) Transcript_14881:111-1214(-)
MTEFQPIEMSEDFEDELEVNLHEIDSNRMTQKSSCKKSCKLGVKTIIFLVILAMAAIFIFKTRRIPPKSNAEVVVNLDVPTASETIETNLPYLIYGTAWKKESTSMLVEDAVLKGFRFIDTANQPKHYNEKGVGAGWTAAASKLGLERKDFYLQTKFSKVSNQDINNMPYNETSSLSEMVFESVKGSLQHLQTDYLDALILHSPYTSMEETLTVWQAMESLVDNGTVLQLGISNFYKYDTLTDLYNNARIKPTILQNHLKTITFDPRFLQFTREHNMQYQAFWTLTSNTHHLEKSDIKNMAARKGLSPQLYMYAFLLALQITPLDGSKTHQAEDVDFFLKLQNGTFQVFETEEDIIAMADALDMPLP